jgi:hypothetical protein
MNAQRHNTAPRTLAVAVVTMPAKSKIIPNAKTIGQGVGTGRFCERRYCRLEFIVVSSQPGPGDSKTLLVEFS